MRINFKSVLIVGVSLVFFACSGNPQPDNDEVISYDFEEAMEEVSSEDIEYYVEVIEDPVEIEERFYSTDYDGYVFGIEWRINQMIDDFRLYWELIE